MLRLVPVLAIGVLLSADALAGWGCRHGEDRSANIDLNGVGLVEVVAGPGDLEIAATASADAVVADGRACSEIEEGLEGIRIITLREGDRVRVIADIEDQDGGRTYNRSLDLRVAVPVGIAVEVMDSSGNALIDGVASVTLSDSSGDVTIRGVPGKVHILRDSSGNIDVRNVGDLVIDTDSSGDIDVQGARSMTVDTDSSGDIRVSDVEGDVYVGADSSGGISARNVGGDFTVQHDGSGDIRYSDISGAIDIPARKRGEY